MTVEADNVSEQLQCRKMHSEDMVRGGGDFECLNLVSYVDRNIPIKLVEG
jgi:hypothetical protein